MKSLKLGLRKIIDKGGVLALGFGCFYLYKQEYIPEVSCPLTVGFTLTGCLGYPMCILPSPSATTKEKMYKKLLQILDKQKSDIVANKTRLEEVMDICHNLLVDKELLKDWESNPALIAARFEILKRLLQARWSSSHRKPQDPKEKVKELFGIGDQKSIFSCKCMKSLGSFLCKAFDKAGVLAVGLGSYLYKQKYPSSFSDPVSCGIIAAAAVIFAGHILKDVYTTTVPEGAVPEYLQEAIAVIIRREIAALEREMAENVQDEIVEKETTEKMEDQVPVIALNVAPEDLQQIMQDVQREIQETKEEVMSDRLKISGKGPDEISNKSFEEMYQELATKMYERQLRKEVEKAHEIVSEEVQGKATVKEQGTLKEEKEVMTEKSLEEKVEKSREIVSEEVQGKATGKEQGTLKEEKEVMTEKSLGEKVEKSHEIVSEKVQGKVTGKEQGTLKEEKEVMTEKSLGEKVEKPHEIVSEEVQEKVIEKEQDTLKREKEVMTEKRQMEVQSRMPEDKSGILGETFLEYIQERSKTLEGKAEQVATGEPLAAGEKKLEILEKEEDVGEDEFENATEN